MTCRWVKKRWKEKGVRSRLKKYPRWQRFLNVIASCFYLERNVRRHRRRYRNSANNCNRSPFGRGMKESPGYGGGDREEGRGMVRRRIILMSLSDFATALPFVPQVRKMCAAAVCRRLWNPEIEKTQPVVGAPSSDSVKLPMVTRGVRNPNKNPPESFS